MRSSGRTSCIARSKACRVPEPGCARSRPRCAGRRRTARVFWQAGSPRAAEHHQLVPLASGVTSSSVCVSSPSTSPRSSSKLATWRAMVSVLATVRVTSAPGCSRKKPRHDRHGEMIADGQGRAHAQSSERVLLGESLLEFVRLLERRLGERPHRRVRTRSALSRLPMRLKRRTWN